MSEQKPETVTLPVAARIFITIEVDGAESKQDFDVYELHALIVEGEEDHGMAGNDRLILLREMIESRFSIAVGKFAINQALDLREAVIGITNRLHEERKKKYASTVNSPVSTPEFPIHTSPGQSEKNKHGSTTPSPLNSGEGT